MSSSNTTLPKVSSSSNTTLPTVSKTDTTTSTTDGDATPKKSNNNQIFGWALVIIIWILVGIFIFMYVGINADLKTCNTTESQTCYMLTCPDSYETATCGTYAYRCDDVEKGKVRCNSNPSLVVDIKSADGDLCDTANFDRCKTTTGSL